MHPSAFPFSPARNGPRWLLPAIGISVLLHSLLLLSPLRKTPPEAQEAPLQIRLEMTSARSDSAVKQAPEQVMVEAVPEKPVMTSGKMPDNSRNTIDWYAEARDVVNEVTVDTSDMLLKPAPARRRGLPVDNARARLPALQEAFAPLQRTRKICGAETTVDFGYYSITMPVGYSCTIEEKRAQMVGREQSEQH